MTQPTAPDVDGRPLAAAVEIARAAAESDAAGVVGGAAGAHVDTQTEDGGAVTYLFEATYPGYRGWRWAVTVCPEVADEPVTVSEVVLLPGPDALVAPQWVPWDQRIRAGDVGVGDLLPTAPDDPRLVPGYVQSDDDAVEEVARELGFGRVRVLSLEGRLDAAQRWHDERGPRSDMAVSAQGTCGTCGFYLPLAGSLRAAFGACGNEYAPADGHVVHVEFGCGAHSEVEVDTSPMTLVAEVVYDDAQLDVVHTPSRTPAAVTTAAGEPTADPVAAEPTAVDASAVGDPTAGVTSAPDRPVETDPVAEPVDPAATSSAVVTSSAAVTSSVGLPETVAATDTVAAPDAAGVDATPAVEPDQQPVVDAIEPSPAPRRRRTARRAQAPAASEA